MRLCWPVVIIAEFYMVPAVAMDFIEAIPDDAHQISLRGVSSEH